MLTLKSVVNDTLDYEDFNRTGNQRQIIRDDIQRLSSKYISNWIYWWLVLTAVQKIILNNKNRHCSFKNLK